MLFKTDLYICERTYPIDERQRDILSYLYLPLIGQRDIEKAGLLKMDFLGLKNLTMIDYILKDLHKEGYDLSLQDIPRILFR